MAINIPIITSLEDTGIKNAKAAFNDFKSAVGNAEGGMGKFKAGANSVMDSVKANAGAFALAGAAAFVGFAKKSITAFQDLALEVDKFSIATGLSAEESSRWAEVTGDLGIEFGSVETAIGRMNRTIGQDPDIFKNLGVDLEYTNTGALDVNATFLNTIEHLKNIKDPAERAKEGVKLLGKGWTDMALLIDQGAGNLSASLASVSDAKIIDRNEISKARNFRDATNDLKDKFEDLAITIGEDLVPQITAIVTTLAPAIELPAKLVSGFAGLKTPTALLLEMGSSLEEVVIQLGAAQVMADTSMTSLELLGAVGTDTGDEILYLAEQSRIYGEYANSMNETIDGSNEVLEEQQEIVTTLTTEWQTLLGTLNTREAFDNLDEALENVFESGVKAFGGSAEEVRKFNATQKDAIDQIADLAIAMDLTFGEQNKLKIYVDSGDLKGARDLLDSLARIAKIGPLYDSGIAQIAGVRALGGPVAPGGTYLVGEQGPELFTPSSAGNITPNHALGGGGTINITVTSADPNEVVRALQTYVRQSGPVPVNTRTM